MARSNSRDTKRPSSGGRNNDRPKTETQTVRDRRQAARNALTGRRDK